MGNLFLNMAYKYVSEPILNDMERNVTNLVLKKEDLKGITGLLKELEESKTKHDIVSLSIASPTMEEVFMK